MGGASPYPPFDSERVLAARVRSHPAMPGHRKAQGVFSEIGVAVEPISPLAAPRYRFFPELCTESVAKRLPRRRKFSAHFTWWSDRFRALKPDFVLTDYAPTALVSALSLGIPRGATGTGFTLPPMTTPMPCLHPWLESPSEALSEAKDMVLDTIGRHVPSLHSVAGIFEGAARFSWYFPKWTILRSGPRKNISDLFLDRHLT